MDENGDREFIEVTDDEGNEETFEVLDYFFYNGVEYAMIADDEEDGEGDEGGEGEEPARSVFFMKVTPLEGDEIQLDPVDEELAEQLTEVVNADFDSEGEDEG